MTRREGHGWWPYLLPLFLFLALGEAAGRFPEAWLPAFLPLKVLLPGGLFLYFLRRGEYAELRGYPDSLGAAALDFAVGLAGAALWMAPFILMLRLEPEYWNALPDAFRPSVEDGFDAGLFGANLAWLALGLRALGYGVVTPFVADASASRARAASGTVPAAMPSISAARVISSNSAGAASVASTM